MIEALETRIAPATLVWLGATDGHWSVGSNWVGGAAPGIGDTLVFDDSGILGTMVNDTPAGTSYHLVFNAALSYSLSGASIALTAGAGLDDGGTGSVEIATVLTGSGGIHQAAGTLKLSSLNTFTGGTAITGGVLQFQSDASLGAVFGDVSIGGSATIQPLSTATTLRNFHVGGNANFAVPAGVTFSISGTVDGPGAISKTGAGNLSFSNPANSFSGNISVASGLLRANGSAIIVDPTTSALGNPQLPNRIIAIAPGSKLEFAKSDVFGIDGSTPQVELFIDGIVTNVAGKFNSLGDVHLSTGGVLTGLGGASPLKQMYALTGDVTSTGGTISGSGGNAGYHIGQATTFRPDGAPLIVSAVLLNSTPGNSLDPLIPDPVALAVNGNDMIWLKAINKFSGGVVLDSGTLRIKSNASLGTAGGEVSIGDGATLEIAPDASITTLSSRAFSLNGEAEFRIPAGKVLSLSGVVQNGGPTGSILVSGGGKLVLSNPGNSFSDGVVIDASKLRISSDSNLGGTSGDITMRAGGLLEVAATITTSRDFTLEGLGRFSIPGGKILTVTGVVQDGATVPGSVGVQGGGTLILGNAGNSFTGTFTISNATMVLNGLTIKLSGPGTSAITPIAGGPGLESIVLTGTTLLSKLIVTSPIAVGASAIPVNHISIPSATDHINVIDLSKSTIVFGDGALDTVPELFIAGKSKSLSFADVNPGALMKLGSGLPYNVIADSTTPDTYNNRPNLKMHDVLGPGVRISVLGDGSVGGVGGGGLGKVIVHRWSPQGTTPPPQPFAPSGGVAADPPPTEYDAVIETTQSIDTFEIIEGDSDVDLLVDANGVGGITKASVNKIKCSKGKWNSTGTKIEDFLGQFDGLSFVGRIELGGIVSEFKTAGNFEGVLVAGEITKLTVYEFLTVVTPASASAKINPIVGSGASTTGDIGTITVTRGVTSGTIAAAGKIGTITIGTNLSSSKIISGAKLGPDGALGGGVGTWNPGKSIGKVGGVTITGTMTDSVIAASIDPVDGVFSGPYGGIGPADTVAMGGAGEVGNIKFGSSIGSVSSTNSIPQSNLVIGKTIDGITAAGVTLVPTKMGATSGIAELRLSSVNNILFYAFS